MQPAPAQALRVSQTVVVALALGSAVFGALGAYVNLTGGLDQAPPNADVGRMLAWVALGMPVMLLPVYFVMRTALLKQLRAMRELAAEQARQDLHPAPLRTLTILGCALAEGVALLAGVVVLLGGPLWALGVLGAGVLAILAQFPTRAQVENLVKDLAL